MVLSQRPRADSISHFTHKSHSADCSNLPKGLKKSPQREKPTANGRKPTNYSQVISVLTVRKEWECLLSLVGFPPESGSQDTVHGRHYRCFLACEMLVCNFSRSRLLLSFSLPHSWELARPFWRKVTGETHQSYIYTIQYTFISI